MLYALAMGSAEKVKDTPKSNPIIHYRKSSSDIPLFHRSFDQRWMIIFLMLFRL